MTVYHKRRIDDLGRVAIPKELRMKLGINEGDELVLFSIGKGSGTIFVRVASNTLMPDEGDEEERPNV